MPPSVRSHAGTSTASPTAYYLSPSSRTDYVSSLGSSDQFKNGSVGKSGSAERSVSKKSSWRSLTRKPSQISTRTNGLPPTPGYLAHPPVSHLSPMPVPPSPSASEQLPLPKKYSSHATPSGPPLASLYLVAGLPKQTHTWTLADAASIKGVQHRPGAVGGWWRAEVLGSNSASSVGVERDGKDGEEWESRLTSKALKYSFTREVEIISSSLQPSSTVHSFSFVLVDQSDPSQLHGRHASSSMGGTEFYGVTLTVYSHADPVKAEAIRKTLASTTLGTSSPPGSQQFGNHSQGHAVPSVVPSKSGGVFDDSHAEGNPQFWLPYALTLVSKYPIYSVMADYLRISWAKFSKNVAAHSSQMTQILQTPSPRPGELLRLHISAPPQTDNSGRLDDGDSLDLIANLPGHTDLNTGLVTVGWEMWALFQVLSLDNVLTIVEIALSPNGRVLFHSRHPALLGIAVLTIKYIVELRGWEGMVHPTVHARDVSLLVEDPGPYILGIGTESKAAARPSSDVAVVDLDINFVQITHPPPNVISSRQVRDRIRGKLVKAFGDGSGYFSSSHGVVPADLLEAYPGGRLKPICLTSPISIDRVQAPEWWNESRVMQAFDRLLADKQKKPSLLRRFGSADHRPKQLSPGEKCARTAMRRRAEQFVDARDEMEAKLGRLSRRLAYLVHETDLWQARFTEFEKLTEKLGTEALELRSKIEKERRESRRLSGALSEREREREMLRQKLQQTEHAQKEAQNKMVEMQRTVINIERERDAMINSIETQLETALYSLHASPNLNDSGHVTPGGMARRVSSSSSSKPSRASSRPPTAGVLDVISPEDVLQSGKRRKRFSAMSKAGGLEVLDARISSQTGDVADKMLAIQMKLDLALKSVARQSIDSPRPSFDGDEDTFSLAGEDTPGNEREDTTFGSTSLPTPTTTMSSEPALTDPSLTPCSPMTQKRASVSTSYRTSGSDAGFVSASEGAEEVRTPSFSSASTSSHVSSDHRQDFADNSPTLSAARPRTIAIDKPIDKTYEHALIHVERASDSTSSNHRPSSTQTDDLTCMQAQQSPPILAFGLSPPDTTPSLISYSASTVSSSGGSTDVDSMRTATGTLTTTKGGRVIVGSNKPRMGLAEAALFPVRGGAGEMKDGGAFRVRVKRNSSGRRESSEIDGLPMY